MKSTRIFEPTQYPERKILEICSDRIFVIKTVDEDNILKLYNFVKFSDNSSVYFDLLCRSSCMEIRNHRFYADFNIFKDFIHKFKKLYNELSGKASLGMFPEDDIIEITATKLGRIIIHCKINHYSDVIQCCDLQFDIDQSYLINMVDEIDLGAVLK